MRVRRPRTIIVNVNQCGDAFLKEYRRKTRRLSDMLKLTVKLSLSIEAFTGAMMKTEKALEEFGRAMTIAWHRAGKVGYH